MKIQEIQVTALKDKMDANESFQLIDVREEYEYEISNLGGLHIPLGSLPNRLAELDPTKELIVMCRSGNRSGRACEFLMQNGFPNAKNLVGGITRWAAFIEPGMPVG
jgi:rhodanese-related sulfurtransferase